MTIVDYFWGTPHRQQLDLLTRLEENWGRGPTCFVIRAPVATGKSRLAVAIADWAASFEKSTAIVPPNGVLQRQYEQEFPHLASLWGGDSYYCLPQRQSCSRTKARKKGNCQECPHLAALRRCESSDTRLMNPYTLLGTRKTVGYPQLVIFD